MYESPCFLFARFRLYEADGTADAFFVRFNGVRSAYAAIQSQNNLIRVPKFDQVQMAVERALNNVHGCLRLRAYLPAIVGNL